MKKKKQIRRNKYPHLKLIVIFSLLIYFDVSRCISLFSQSDSLTNYMALAARNNPGVLQRFSEYKAALQKVPQVGALSDPEFNAGVFVQPMELVEGKQLADFQLMQMFPWFGTLRAAKDEMSLMAKAKYELFHDAELEVFYDVQRTWYELYKIGQEKRISEKNKQILKTIERLAIVRFKTSSTGSSGSSSQSMGSGSSVTQQGTLSGSSGMQSMTGGQPQSSGLGAQALSVQDNTMGASSEGGSLSDLYRIQIEIGELENDITLLESLKNTVIARFNSYLDRPVQTTVTIPDTLINDTLNIPLKAVSDSLLRNNPMLGMLQYEQQSYEARRKMAVRMGNPMVGIGVDYSLIAKSEMSTSSMNGQDMIMPMIKLTLPVYRQKYNALRSEAGLLKTASAQNYSATANTLQTEYYQAVQLYQDAQRRIKLYANQSLLANKTLDLMLIRFSTSGGGLTDILRIRQQTLDYELKSVEAIADYNTGIAWLKRLMAYYLVK